MRKAASVRRLREIKDVTEQDAKEVRAIWKAKTWAELNKIAPGAETENLKCFSRPKFGHAKRHEINRVLATMGVEYLGTYYDTNLYHCNAGDMYADTIVFVGRDLRAGCIADFMDSPGFRAPGTD